MLSTKWFYRITRRSALLLGMLLVCLLPVAAGAAPTQQLPGPDTPLVFLPIVQRAGGPLATVTSPDGLLQIVVTISRPASRTGLLHFSAVRDGQPLLSDGRLGLSAVGVAPENGSTFPLFAPDVEYTLTGVATRSVRSQYALAVGERSLVPDNFNEATISLRSNETPARHLQLVVRAYDEGLALRYAIPAQVGVARARITADSAQFLFPPATIAWEQRPLGNGWSEGTYARVAVSGLNSKVAMPLTLELPGGVWAALFEAAVDNFARSSLTRVGGAAPGVALHLEGPSEGALPYATPWRTLLVAPTAGGLLEQNYLLYNLAPPPAYSAQTVSDFAAMAGTAMRVPADRSEVHYGTSVYIFSNQTAKNVADFAAARGIKYIEFDTDWYGPEFAIESDPRVPLGGLSIAEVAAYAATKGVGVILYVNQTQLNDNIDLILPAYRSWGVKGIKLGYVDGTTQQGINLIHHSVRTAAENGMFVDVHDAYLPSGMTRTWPNLFTQEGVAGAEQRLNGDHSANLPFTRFVIGAADYTLPYYATSLATTRGHRLGQAVLFYSPLNFVFWGDGPADYDGSAGADFLAGLPTTWDESHVLLAAPAEAAAIARRKGEQWYVGAITNSSARTVELTLDFLAPGAAYTARILSESAPNVVGVEERAVVLGDVVEAALLANGGLAMQIFPTP